MTVVAAILAIALAVTLAALWVVLAGTSQMLDIERARTDAAEARVRELEAERVTTTRNVRPLAESPSFAPVADILARNEAARANWDDINGWLS